MSVVDNDRPPYVMFERRPVEDRTESSKAGHYVSKDVDFAIITRPGSRDTVEKEAVPWLAELDTRVRAKSIPANWAQAFRESYNAWKKGEELPENGTPIKGWQMLGPAAQKDLIQAGVRTVEDLANLPDGEIGQLGTGGISLKQKATAWLAAAKDTGKAAAQIADLSAKVTQLVELSTQQAQEIKALRAQIPTFAKAA